MMKPVVFVRVGEIDMMGVFLAGEARIFFRPLWKKNLPRLKAIEQRPGKIWERRRFCPTAVVHRMFRPVLFGSVFSPADPDN